MTVSCLSTISRVERRGADLKLEADGEKPFILGRANGSCRAERVRHGAKNLACRADFLARVNGV